MRADNKRRKRIILKPRFYFFLVLFIVLIIWLVTAVTRLFTPTIIEWGRLSTDQEISAIIIRDEQVVVSSEYGKFESIVGESEYVEQGNEIAILYKSGFSEDDVENLISVQQDIKNYQEESILKNIIHEDLIYIDEEIDRLINEISNLIRNSDDRALPAKERELKIVMERRRVYLNENLHIDSVLEKKFQLEKVLKEKILRDVINLQSPNTGIISFFLDNMENNLKIDIVEQIDIDDYTLIEDLLLNSSIQSNINNGAMVAKDQAIYRIINPNHWFAVIKLLRGQNTLVKGGTCDVTFDSYGQTLSNVYVLDVRQYGKEVIVVLEINSDIGSMTSLRIATGHIGWSNEGFIVPIDMLSSRDNKIGILVIKEDKTQVFIPVDILAQDYFEAIIAASAGSAEKLSVGLELVEP